MNIAQDSVMRDRTAREAKAKHMSSEAIGRTSNVVSARRSAAVVSTDLGGLLSILGRYWVTILATTAACTLAAIAYLIITPPTYSASATLLIDPRPKKIVSDDTYQAGVGTDLALLESQVAIIRSDAVLGRVVDTLGLVNDPEFVTTGGQGIGAKIKSALGLPTRLPEPRTQAIVSLANRVVVKRAQKTYVVEIEANSEQPAKASTLALAVANAYLADQTTAKSEEAKRANELIDARLGELREQVRSAETRIDDFRRKNRLVTSEGGTIGEQQLTRLNAELIAARSQASEAKARFDEVSTAARAGSFEAVTDPAKTGLVQRLREQLAQVSRREAALSAQLLPKHPVLLDIRSQSAEIKSQINSELKRLSAAAKSEYLVAEAREKEIQKSLEATQREVARTNTAQIKQRELEQEAAASRELLRIFLARSKETQEQQKISTPDARMLSPPSIPTRPSKPIPALILALGVLGGLAGGIARALVGDLFDRRIRTPADATSATGLPTLATLPKLDPATQGARGATYPSSRKTHSSPPRGRSVIESSKLAPFASAASGTAGPAGRAYREAIVGAQSAIRAKTVAAPGHTVLLAGAGAAVGTTTTAFSLAYSAAAAGDRVLLIDASSADAGLSEILDCPVPQDRTITLDSKPDLASIMTIDAQSGLAVLPIALADLRTLESSQRARLLNGLVTLAEDFDLVVIDAGAALEDASSLIVLPLADEVMLVARAGATEGRALAALAQHLDFARDRLAGVIITHAGG